MKELIDLYTVDREHAGMTAEAQLSARRRKLYSVPEGPDRLSVLRERRTRYMELIALLKVDR